MARVRPGLIYLSECAYGHTGPWAMRKGWENIAQATTGVTIDHGTEDSPMRPPPELLTDSGKRSGGSSREVAGRRRNQFVSLMRLSASARRVPGRDSHPAPWTGTRLHGLTLSWLSGTIGPDAPTAN